MIGLPKEIGDCNIEAIEVRRGPVSSELQGGQKIVNLFMEFNSTECLFDIPETGRFLVKNGNSITVQIENRTAESDMRAFLFGSIFGALLHQRGLIPLHVSSVVTPRGLVAFTGDSGAGKSTLAGLINKKTNWPIFSDDVAVLRPEDEEPILYAGILRLKLWKDAVALLNFDSNELTRDVARYDKFHVHAPENFALKPVHLHALIMLSRGKTLQITPISGAKLFEATMNSIYRPYFVPMFNSRSTVAQKCAQVAGQIQSYLLERVWSQEGLENSANAIIAKFDE